MQSSVCVRFLQILLAGLAMMEVQAIGSQRDYLLGGAAAIAVAGRIPRSTRYNQRSPFQDYFSDDGRNHHDEDIVAARVSSKPSAEGSTSRDDYNATSRHRLQQTSTSTAEVQVLMAFKEGVTNDSLGALKGWNASDANACHWTGVTCAQQSNSIVALELGNFGLMGTVSPILGRLKNLQTLDLSDNSFSGEIPNSLVNCSSLSFLALRNNNLTGQIPSQVGDLLHLQYLDLGYNLLLAGLIPASLSNCSLLRLIQLDYTSLSGKIPSGLGQLAHLEGLNLTNTYNSGTIPESLGNCSYLTALLVGNAYDLEYAVINPNNLEDELSGELPAELAKLKRLKTLGISGTIVRGVFPSWIGNLTALSTLDLSFNSFTGEIPEFLGNLPLEYLRLAGSSFSGDIPATIANCSNLWFLGIAANPDVSGAIPPELGMLSKLGALELFENSLNGTIPSSLSNCSALRVLEIGENTWLDPQPLPSWISSLVNLSSLYLGNMNLHGEIPMALGELSKLDDLSLWGNQLSGAIPASLGNCTALYIVEIDQNQLSGEVPPEMWMLSQLQSFQLGSNLLTGTLPESIGNLSSLQIFTCYTNSFNGAIPSQLGSLQSLDTADFNTNFFSGSIPQSLGNCSALRILYTWRNNLSGSIPVSLGNLTALEKLDLSDNRLEGGIPVDLMRCTSLAYLNLSHNLLVGSIPLEIRQLISLQDLILNDNKLSGGLPNSLGQLTGLWNLDISDNAFQGALPGGAIANMSTVLKSLNVSHNRLSGSLPPELEKLTVVYYLDFSDNNFSGSIPAGLSDCKSLTILDLSINNISGGIPPSLAQLQNLAFVNLSYNHLQGPVPDGGLFNSSNLTAASFLGNPGLCGSMLKLGCPVGLSPASASTCKAFRCSSVRRAVEIASAGAGVVLVLIAAVVVIYLLFYHHGKDNNAKFSAVTFATGLKVSEEELLSIIERPENKIGVGATSTVYKGVLSGGIVAIKVLSLLNDPDDHEHQQQTVDQLYLEAHTLAELKHRNILKVLGLFSTQTIKGLIVEFMPNASLHHILYDVEECELSWEARLNIALGMAQGVLYLHSQFHMPIIHRDLKPSNIFLDGDLEPKLGDFGISLSVNPDRLEDGEITASKFCGTLGYIPPEYAATTRVSTKGDVYSYGVILLELLTRKHPIMADSEDSDLGQNGQQSRHLVDWVLQSAKERPLAVLDPMLLISESISPSNGEDNNSGEQMKLLMQVGLLCTQEDPQSRPQMSDVLGMLIQIKERGSDRAHHPSVAELANEVTVWSTPDVNDAAHSVC